MKNQKTKYVKIRVTLDEAAQIKDKAASYTSITHYVRSALAEYSNTNAKQRLELINELGSFYRKFQNELSWAGSNLNQSVRRVNELAVAGLLSPGYVNEVLLPSIQDVQNILKRIKDDLETLNNRTRLIK